MPFEITEPFLNELDKCFKEFFEQKGSQLINHVRIEKVQGYSQIVPQLDWSDTEDAKIQNENRLLEPKLIKEIKITLSDVEVIRQGEPTADELAE